MDLPPFLRALPLALKTLSLPRRGVLSLVLPGRARGPIPIGIDLSSRHIRLAAFDPRSADPRLTHLLQVPVPRSAMQGDEILDVEGLTEEVQRLLADAGISRPAATVLAAGGDVFVRRLALPRSSRIDAIRALPSHKEMKGAIGDLEHHVFDVAVLDGNASGPTMPVLAVTAKKDAIRTRQRIVQESGCTVHAVDVPGFALANAFAALAIQPAGGRATLLDIGHDSSLVVVLEQGAPVVLRHIEIGVAGLVEAIASSATLPTEDVERTIASAAAIDMGAFNSWADRLATEAQRTAGAARGANTSLGELRLSGVGVLIEGIVARLSEQTGVPVAIFDPLTGLERSDTIEFRRAHEGSLYTLAIGAALRQIL